MHEVAPRFAEAIGEPLAELDALAGLSDGQLAAALGGETFLSLVPEMLDDAAGDPTDVDIHRFHQPTGQAGARSPEWGDPDRPLVYVTYGSVAGSLPPFAGVFQDSLDAFADLDAQVVMTVGRSFDTSTLGTLPDNAYVAAWLPQDAVLAHATAMVGHGGFGTTMGALAAAVPQVVVPLFSFDQVVNGDHVAAVGAGICTGMREEGVQAAAAALPSVIADPSYAEAAGGVAAAMRALPPPAEVVPVLEQAAGA
jgi:MGT family glycosyltransferase